MVAPTIATVENDVEDRNSREDQKRDESRDAFSLSRQNAVDDEKPSWETDYERHRLQPDRQGSPPAFERGVGFHRDEGVPPRQCPQWVENGYERPADKQTFAARVNVAFRTGCQCRLLAQSRPRLWKPGPWAGPIQLGDSGLPARLQRTANPSGPFPAENPDGLPGSVAARSIGREERSCSRGAVFGESASIELKTVISKAPLKAHRFREAAQRAARLRME